MAKERKQKKVNGIRSKMSRIKRNHKGYFVLIILLIIMIVISLCSLLFAIYIMLSAPDFQVNKLYKSSSSTILDKNGAVIAELGAEMRENVTFDELPDVLVDAIVATEDSKYFQHSGVDLMRFTKAVLGQFMGRSDAGGGSTLTMQIVKNTYNGTVSSGIAGIVRKFTDIYMAVFKLEKTYTKQEIIEFYVNQPYLGPGIYGVGQAAQTFFKKDVGELNLSEAALLAGLFQAPGAYNPFAYPEKAEARRNQVLALMVRHGYITQEEANIAKAIHVSDLLANTSSGTIYKYQDFIDTVVADIYEKTGQNPYMTSMTVYTTMDPDRQNAVNKLYAGDTYKWKNDYVQCGVAVTDVSDGSVVAIGARRNRTGVSQYNYATDIKRHPGSTAKPIFDYGPAIEYAGWGTGTMVIDDKYSYTNGGNLQNVDYTYKGIMTAKTALANSRNVPALQAFQQTTNEQKLEFVHSLGINPKLYNGTILESAAIGAFDGTNPLEMAAAYGAFARGGYYIKPYSFTKIVYNETNETYTYTPVKTKVMSEETAFMINMILKYAVTSGIINPGSVSGTDLASKTGTTSVDGTQRVRLGLPSNTIGDAWQMAYSPDYTVAVWYGYDEQLNKEHYLTSTEGWSERGKIVRALTPYIFKKNSRWKQPKGVVAVDIEYGTNPTLLASDYTPDDLRSTEYFKKGTEPTDVSTRFFGLANPTNLTYSNVGNQITLSWTPISTPDAINPTYLQEYFDKAYSGWSTKYYEQRLEYNEKNIGILQYEIFIKNSDGTLESLGMTSGNSYQVTLTNATSATYVVKSRYSIFSANASSGAEINVRITSLIDIPDNNDDNNNNGNNDNNDEPEPQNDNLEP